MTFQNLKIMASLATILTGLISLFWPRKVLDFTGLEGVGARGITEVRTILGALFVGLGAAVLYFNVPVGFQILGVTYIVMAIVRTISIYLDDSSTSSNTISAIAEIAFGLILIL